MDWMTIRVLTKNLEELLEQYERGEHLEMRADGSNHETREQVQVKEDWWVGIRGLTASLAREFNFGPQDLPHATGFTFHIPAKANPYMRQVIALVALGRKLLADWDAATSAARTVEPAVVRP